MLFCTALNGNAYFIYIIRIVICKQPIGQKAQGIWFWKTVCGTWSNSAKSFLKKSAFVFKRIEICRSGRHDVANRISFISNIVDPQSPSPAPGNQYAQWHKQSSKTGQWHRPSADRNFMFAGIPDNSNGSTDQSAIKS